MFESKAAEIEREQKALQKKLRKLADEKEEIENEDLVEFEESWTETGVRIKDRVVKYPPGEAVPFEKFEVTYQGETSYEIVSTDPKDFELRFTSSRGAGKILSGVGGFLMSAAGVMLADAAPPLGFALATKGGEMVGKSLVKTFQAAVKFFVHPKYFPENVDKISRIVNATVDLVRKAAVLKERKDLLLKSSSEALIDKVKNALKIEEEELKLFEDFLTFGTKVHRLYQQRSNNMKQLFDVITSFYPNDKSYSDFVDHFKQVFNGEIVPETNETNILVSDIDIHDLADKLLKLFPDM